MVDTPDNSRAIDRVNRGTGNVPFDRRTGAKTTASTQTGGDTRPAAQPDQKAASQELGISNEGIALATFIKLLEKGPVNQRAAPMSITLPPGLYAALRKAANESLSDGDERGGVFGYFPGRAVKFGILYAKKGGAFEVEQPAPRVWPALKRLGTFHVHLYQLSDRGGGRGAGGGHSGADLTNFLRGEQNASIVYAQTMYAPWKIYFLLKPQEAHLPGGPGKVGKDYEQRVMTLAAKGVNLIVASEVELKGLAQEGAFVFYSSLDSSTLARQ
jgi:hypothetical protein